MGAKKFHSDTKRIGKKRPSSGEISECKGSGGFVDRYQPKATFGKCGDLLRL